MFLPWLRYFLVLAVLAFVTPVLAIENKPPSVALSTPGPCAKQFAPATINLRADTSDPDGAVVSVAFYANGALLHTDESNADKKYPGVLPSQYSWTNIPVGTYTITIVATDDLGASTTSAPVTLMIAERTPPTVSITSPGNGDSLMQGTATTIYAAAAGDSTVTSIAYYANDSLIGTRFGPFWLNWTPESAGSIALVAVATDDAGLTATSAPVNVMVNTPHLPPSVSLATPSTGTVVGVGSSVLVSANVLADPGHSITKVDFFAGNSRIANLLTPPYTADWIPTTTGTVALTAVATDDAGASATSAIVNVSVRAPPTISITAPIPGTTLLPPATLTVAAEATHKEGTLSQMEIFQNDVSIGTVAVPAGLNRFTQNVNWTGIASGIYTLTAKATDNSGLVTTSAPVQLIVNDPPMVSLAYPVNNRNFVAPANVYIGANASDTDGSIARIDFYNGATLIGSTTTAPYTFNWPNVPAGSYVLTAIATDNFGGSATSAPVAIVVENWALNVTSPISDSTVYGNSVNVSGTFSGASPTGVAVNGQTATLGSGTFSTDIPIRPGANTITVVASSPSGNITKTLQVSGIVHAITLDPDIADATIADSTIAISGIVQGPRNATVLLDGKPITLTADGHFFVDNEPLQTGATSSRILTLVSLDGALDTLAFSITSIGQAPFSASIEPPSGAVPLTAKVTIANPGSAAFERIEINPANGDAVQSYINLSEPMNLTYKAGGYYAPTIDIYNKNNQLIYTKTLHVYAYDPRDVIDSVAGVYRDMLTRLDAGNIDGALRSLSSGLQPQFRSFFTQLGDALPAVTANLGTMHSLTLGGDWAELWITQIRDGSTQEYPVQLVRGADGLWRIDGM